MEKGDDQKDNDKKETRTKLFSSLYNSTAGIVNKASDKIKKSVKSISGVVKKENAPSTTDEKNNSGTSRIQQKKLIIIEQSLTDNPEIENDSEFKDLLCFEEDIEDVSDANLLGEGMTVVHTERLDQLLQDVTDIKEMSMDISGLLDTQGKQLEKVEDNIISTDRHIVQGTKELEKAKKYKNDGIINVVGVTGGAITGSIAGPLGAAVGAAVGLTSTVIINALR